MMEALKHFFWLNKVEPVTHKDVSPAEPPPMQDLAVRAAQTDLIQAVMALERSSVTARRELASSALSIVAGVGK